MTFPASDVNDTNTTSPSTAGQPAAFRADALDLITKFNLLRNWFSTLGQSLVNAANAAAARVVLGVSTVGDAVFTAANAGVARTTLGSTTVGDAVFTAASAAAARATLVAAESGGNSSITSLSGIPNVTLSTNGIGYTAGAGGIVTQTGSLGTSVTLNKLTGFVQTVSAGIASHSYADFTISNSKVQAGDVIVISSGDPSMVVSASAQAGGIYIRLNNFMSYTQSGPFSFSFLVLKGQ